MRRSNPATRWTGSPTASSATRAKCDFDPASLQCGGDATGECLAAPQVEAVKKLYAGPEDQRRRAALRRAAAGQRVPVGLAGRRPGDVPRRRLLQVPRLRRRRLGLAHDELRHGRRQPPERRSAPMSTTSQTDLSAFNASGGKLIMYNGLADALIQPGNAVEYYEVSAEGLRPTPKTSRASTSRRAWRHCSSGPGPNAFGGTRYLNAGQPNPPVLDPEHDVISAIVAWVEESAGCDRSDEIHGRRPFEGDRDAAAALPLSAGGSIRWRRRSQRRTSQLRLRGVRPPEPATVATRGSPRYPCRRSGHRVD